VIIQYRAAHYDAGREDERMPVRGGEQDFSVSRHHCRWLSPTFRRKSAYARHQVTVARPVYRIGVTPGDRVEENYDRCWRHAHKMSRRLVKMFHCDHLHDYIHPAGRPAIVIGSPDRTRFAASAVRRKIAHVNSIYLHDMLSPAGPPGRRTI
jgi:hypothetical protein